jgi:hypothetical protein
VEADLFRFADDEALAGDDEAAGGENVAGESDADVLVRLPGDAELAAIADGVEDAVEKAREDRVAGYGLTRGVVDEDDGVGAFEPCGGRDFLFWVGQDSSDDLYASRFRSLVKRRRAEKLGEKCRLAIGVAAEDLLVDDGGGHEEETEEEDEGGDIAGAGGGGGAEVFAEERAERIDGEGGGEAEAVRGLCVFERGGLEHLVGVAMAEGGGVQVQGEGVEAEARLGGSVHARGSGMLAETRNGMRVRTRTPLLRARLTDWARRVVSAERARWPRAERR